MVTQAPPAPGTEVQPPVPIAAPEQPLAPPVDTAAPAAPVVPPVAATPETPLPTPTTDLSAPLPLPPQVQEQLSYQVRITQMEHQQRVQALETWFAQYKADLMQSDGLSEERATKLALDRFGPELQQENAAFAQKGWGHVAATLNKLYGIPTEKLAGMTDPKAMEGIAANWKENQTLRAELAKTRAQLKRLTTPPAGGQPPVYMGGQTPAAAAANKDNIDGLYMKWEREHPNDINPYARQYRQMLGM